MQQFKKSTHCEWHGFGNMSCSNLKMCVCYLKVI